MSTASENLVSLLQQRAAANGEGVAFTYLADGELTEENLTYAGLEERAKGIAALLSGYARPGDRVVLLYPPGLDYIAAFFGCLYGGFIAVPAYPPDPSRLNRTLPRLQAIVNDAGANVVLATGPILGMTELLATIAPDLSQKRWLATDVLQESLARDWRSPVIRPDSLAFLQYTSGSTGVPRGVMLTHRNLIANERMIQEVFKLTPESVGVGWLPLYHDMGLIGNVLQPIYTGFRCILMSPLDFLHRPLRWLEAISRYHGTGSGAPNFAYDLCVRKITAEDREHLDLSSWKLAFSGSEPVRSDTLERFARTFADCGFRAEAFLPCYGLAEASLIVSGKTMGTPYRVAMLDARSLEAGRAVVSNATGTDTRALVSNGCPVEGSHVLVADPLARTRCPEGRIGEIWVSGPHVAQGYWKDAEKTMRTFGARIVDGPLKNVAFLRTGDLGFMLAGEVYVSGRLKDLIIIRGRNYYPQDIERVAEEAYPTLRRGCTAAFSIHVEGEERLVLAVEVERRVRTMDRRALPARAVVGELRSGSDRRASDPAPGLGADARASFDAEEIYATVRRAISEHFGLRVHAIALLKAGSIPKTSSGKIQRHASCAAYLEGTLDIIDQAVDDESTSSVRLTVADLQAARTSERNAMLIAYVRTEIARVLRVPVGQVDVEAPLNGLGLDSLAAIEVNHAIERSLGVTLPATALLRSSSVADLAASIFPLLTLAPSTPGLGAPPSSRPPQSERPEPAEFPLSAGQHALWFLHRLAPTSPAYNLTTALRVEGEFVAAAAESALRALVARHPALHTTYADVGGKPYQRTRPELVDGFRLETHDASAWNEDELSRRLSEEANRPFDLSNGPVFRASLFRVREHECVLFLAVHHIAADLWSIVLLLRELRSIYPAVRAGRGSPNVVETGERYRAFVERQGAYLASDSERDWSYWRGQLAGVPDLNLPTDRLRPRVQTYRGDTEPIRLDGDLVAQVTNVAKREGVTVYVVLLATFQVLLSRITGQSSFLVGGPVAGRPSAAYDRVVGYFVNALPMRADLEGDPTVAELFQRVRGVVLGALEHQEFPFATAVERLRGPRDPSRSPLFQAMFALEKAYQEQEAEVTMLVLGASDAKVEYAGLTVSCFPIARRMAQFDLTLNLAHSDGALAGALEYNTDLFESGTIRRLASQLEMLLRAIVAMPETRVRDLPLLTATEEQALARRARASARFPFREGLHERFERQAKLTPDALAVTAGDQKLMYAELDTRAAKLAGHMIRLGVRHGDIVAMRLERSLDLVVAVVAILKTGAAYLPLDPVYPADRVNFMLAESKARVVLTQRELDPIFDRSSIHVVYLDADARAIAEEAPARSVRVAPTSLAYIIYTSGSSGRPKGVEVTHANVTRLFDATDAWYHFDPTDVWTLFHSIAFDFSVWELWGALLYGGRLVVVPYLVSRSPDEFYQLLVSERVTVLNQTPSAFRQLMLVDAERARPLSLRYVIFGGEALDIAALAPWFERHGETAPTLVNMYGITETTVHVTYRALRARDTKGGSVIGVPIPDLSLRILDPRGRPVPIGVPGEIFVGGDGLARGYRARPDLSAQRFVPDGYGADGEHSRLYRTGDLARYLANGDLEYLGRIDQQVKIRGFRIELGEIESSLSELQGVHECVVLARQDNPGDKRLVAYVAGTASPKDMRDALARKLPDYMVPSAFVILESLPLTSNGKIDRRALPAPELKSTSEFVAPRTELERELCAICQSVLGVPRVGVNDSFFELGGHSLLATQFVSRVRSTLHVDIEVATLFEYPTVAQLARACFENSVEGEV